MTNLTYEHICSATGCKFHVVWDFGHGDCYSCRKIGESYHVTEYPQDCPFRSEMQRYESEAEEGTTELTQEKCVHYYQTDEDGVKRCVYCRKEVEF